MGSDASRLPVGWVGMSIEADAFRADGRKAGRADPNIPTQVRLESKAH